MDTRLGVSGDQEYGHKTWGPGTNLCIKAVLVDSLHLYREHCPHFLSGPGASSALMSNLPYLQVRRGDRSIRGSKVEEGQVVRKPGGQVSRKPGVQEVRWALDQVMRNQVANRFHQEHKI